MDNVFGFDSLFGFGDDTQRRKVAINHPLADEVSVISGPGTHSDAVTREIAFFKDGEWVDRFPYFKDYMDGDYKGTMVFNYVPINVLTFFLNTYAVGAYRI